ncbi:MAG: CsgG/HfaB family protein [Desulfobacterales bacterium]|nr:CsgG/HfaB family protein [Desulfobacterales bacterium]
MALKNFFKAKFFRFILLPALLFGFSDNIKAQDTAMVVQAIGTGIIRGNDIPTARDEALSDAMVSSVQQAVADLAPVETIVSNFKKLDESIFANIGDYILEYKVLAENTSGKTYRIMVEATLFLEKISKMISSLETVSTETDLPKVLLFLAEQNIDDIMLSYWWGEDPTFVKSHSEKAVAHELVEQGFSIIDHEGMLLYQQDMTHVNNPYLGNEEAIQLGQSLKADIIVVGTAIAEAVPDNKGANTRSCKADLSVRAIRIDTGEVITSVDQQSVAVSGDNASGGSDALSNAGTLAGKALAPRIAQAWKNSEATSEQIEIFVRGIGDLGSFVSFRKSLSETSGVSNLRIKETMGDEATLWVDYTDSTETLAETIMEKSYDRFRINIVEVGHKHISIDLIPDQSAPRR